MKQWVILVPRGAEYQAVSRGLARREAIRRNILQNADGNAEVNFKVNCKVNLEVDFEVNAIAIPAGIAVKNWIETEFKSKLQSKLQSQNPMQILVMGLCGGLSDRTTIGAVVIYEEPELAAKLGIQSVRGVTIDRVLCLAREKRELSRANGADVVDMESQHLVTYSQSCGLPVRVLRVVSDDARGDLPDLSAAFDGAGTLQPWALTIAFLRQPMAAVRLIRGSLVALKQLEHLAAELDFDRLAV